MNELEALGLLRRMFGSKDEKVLLGLGDDCAVLELNPQKLLIASTDTVVQNTHFFIDKIRPEQIGKKAVAVAVSDIAAMGGKPRFILSSIGFKRETSQLFLKSVLNGIEGACLDFNIELVGGNLAGSETLFIDVTALGEINSGDVVKRSGATVGEDIYVTGTLGDSTLGLEFLKASKRCESLINKHLEPAPRLNIGERLAERKIASSMIDISDGLFLDLGRITTEFGLGAEISLDKLPLSERYLSSYKFFTDDVYEYAVTGGEDYELLFTASAKKSFLVEELSLETGILISNVGRVTDSKELVFVDDKKERRSFNKKGFIHFDV